MFGDFGSFKIISKINQFRQKRKYKFNNRIILCVPTTVLHFFNKKLKSKYVSLGAQNCHYHNKYGPFTGSVSAAMIKKSGAQFVILGHSENRSEGETNHLLKSKIKAALSENLSVIFCIGETYKEKKTGQTFSILKKQIRESVEKSFNLRRIILAYEPVWSIGTNKIPKMHELQKTMKFIKEEFKKHFKTKKNPLTLYGGSVNSKNITLFTSITEIDGFLIGGASQSSKKFIDIIKNYYK
tara:strand:+ start:880 stop:1599 length:720 start_codon:yes stop_codon:yes gene_type:complete